MTTTIRPFTPADYPAVVDIHNTAWPDERIDVDEMRFDDEHRDAKCRHGRWVAEVDGEIVGWAQHDQLAGRYHPDKYWLEFCVHPARQRRGIGSALYDTVLAALQPLNPWLVRVALREDMTGCLAWLARRGFQEDWRSWESRLDVTRFDPTPFAGYQERLAAHGVTVRTFRDLADDPDRDRKLFDLLAEVRPDAPMRDEATPVDYETWRQSVIYGRYMDEDGYFVAVRDGEYLGLSNLMRPKPGQDVETGYTGVARRARGQGLAQALKLRVLDYARQQGYQFVRTVNNSLNYPMLAINAKLGFERLPAWVYYVKYLRDDDVNPHRE